VDHRGAGILPAAIHIIVAICAQMSVTFIGESFGQQALV
jgi:hypothetical protein